jgi:hypothetical protein
MKLVFKHFIILAFSLSPIFTGRALFCPRYSCINYNDGPCISIQSAIDDKGYNIINLTDQACKGEEVCNVGDTPWFDLAISKRDDKFTCKPEYDYKFGIRFPGEECTTDSNCFIYDDITGHCKEGRCTGRKEGDSCQSHTQCLVGLYCNGEICSQQKAFNATCVESVECQNKYLCSKGKCQLTPYTLDPGESLDKGLDSFDVFKCKFRFMDSYRKCTYFIQQEDGEDGFVKCKYGKTCKYITFSGEERTQPCHCGYNSEGQGYCPQGHNKSNFI